MAHNDTSTPINSACLFCQSAASESAAIDPIVNYIELTITSASAICELLQLPVPFQERLTVTHSSVCSDCYCQIKSAGLILNKITRLKLQLRVVRDYLLGKLKIKTVKPTTCTSGLRNEIVELIPNSLISISNEMEETTSHNFEDNPTIVRRSTRSRKVNSKYALTEKFSSIMKRKLPSRKENPEKNQSGSAEFVHVGKGDVVDLLSNSPIEADVDPVHEDYSSDSSDPGYDEDNNNTTTGRGVISTSRFEYLHCPRDNCKFKFKILPNSELPTETKLNAHVKRYHDGDPTPYPCPHCPKSFAHSNQLIPHINAHTGNKPYICEYCGKRFHGQRQVKIHTKIHTRSSTRPYECSVCNDKFHDLMTLNSHKLRHSDSRQFICEICSSEFIRKLDLQNHQRFKHSESLGLDQYKCGVCSKVFVKKLYLKAHEKSHVSAGEFKCSFCNYRSHLNCTTRAHEKLHTKDRIYECGMCDKSYKYEIHLEIHMRSHTGDRPFKCRTCGKGYKAYSHLYQHEQTHSKVIKFNCQFCTQGFVLRKYLLRHEERHRKGGLKGRRIIPPARKDM